MNTVNLIGRWARDNELRFSQSGVAVLKNAIAVNRPFSKTKEVDFFDVTVFGKVAENTTNYTKKGTLVGITGRLQQEKWQTDDGQNRSRVVVIANEVEFLEYANQSPNQQNYQQDTEENFGVDDFHAVDADDDIPF